jgi:hypothetical protein
MKGTAKGAGIETVVTDGNCLFRRFRFVAFEIIQNNTGLRTIC